MKIPSLRRCGPALAGALLGLLSCSSPEPGGPPIRTATTRALLPTAVQSLLLDPFITTDTSWGHLVGMLSPGLSMVPPVCDLVSQSPAGVAAPVARFPTLTSQGAQAKSLQIVAPLVGGTAPLQADVWVSASNAQGAPLDYTGVAMGMTASLLPNDQPGMMVPLAQQEAPVEWAGRQWVKLALPAPTAMSQGGWFSLTVIDPSTQYQFQAPEVMPAPAGATGATAALQQRRADSGAVLAAYMEITRR